MEDDNNNNNNNNNKKGILGKAVDIGKQEIKNRAKSKAKSKFFKILMKLLPVIITLLEVCLVIGVIFAIVTTIFNAVNKFISGDSTTTVEAATIEQTANAAVRLSSDGYNYIINDDYVDNIIDSLNKYNLAPNGWGLTNADYETQYKSGSSIEGTDVKESMIRKYVKAEVTTMFPKIGSSGVDGIITIKRDDGENGTELKDLQYMPYDSFNSLLESGSENAQNYFSLNPSTFQLCFSTANIVERYNSAGNQTERTVTLSKNEIDYQYLVAPFAMPLNFLVSTHMIAQKEDFMNDLLNLQMNDAVIEVILKDTVNTNVITANYSGEAYEEVDGKIVTHEVNNSNVSTYYATAKPFKTVYTDRSTEVLVHKADTWIASKEYEYKKSNSGNLEQDTQTSNIKSEQYDIRETVNETLSYTTYNIINNDTNLDDNVQKIIDLFNQDKYFSVKYNFYINPNLYFLLLNKDEKTQNIEQIMRYVLYKVTGVDYGVKDLKDLTSLFEVQMTVFSANDYVVKTDVTNAAPVAPSKSELENALKKWLRTNSKMKSNALSVLDTVWQAQEQYKVNALFTYAYLRTETGIGIANTNYVKVDNNWGSWSLGTKYSSPQHNIETITRGFANGGIYFPKNISVDQIGHIYCPNMPQYPTQGDDWVKTVQGYMSELYSLLGITIESSGGQIATGGPGTLGTYKSGTSGRTFNLYLQYNGTWAGNKYGNSSPWTMAANGCGPTAAAIIASGYNGSINPETVRKYVINTMHGGRVANYSSAADMAKALQGMNIGVKTQVGSFDSNKVKNTLKSGGQVWFVVGRSRYTNRCTLYVSN